MPARFLGPTTALSAALLTLLVAVTTAVAAPPNRASGKGDSPTAGALGGTTAAQRNARRSATECPNGLACRVVPAAYEQNSADPSDYGNYDLANRPADGLAVRYAIIHDTEVLYDPTVALFQNSHAYVSAHYVLRSSDGEVTQMVPTRNVAWHAGNWWINTHAIGYENEGFAIEGGQWFTNQLYGSLARLVRYNAERYGFPADRAHILGHDEVPGPTAAFQGGMHWDPGPFFDWAHFMALVGSPINGAGGDMTGRTVTIAPTFERNQPAIRDCEGGGDLLPSQPANFVYLHTGPSDTSPLVDEPFLPGPGTTCANDWGDKAVTGQTFAVAEREGDWLAVWYGGQKAWLHDPNGRNTVAGAGTLVTPKAGLASIPVYGRAYPSTVSTATLGYVIPAGQTYVATDVVGADYYDAPTFTLDPADHTVFSSGERFYQITFNHRIAFVRATDVDVVN
ncbi:MAG: N-acetylmuramoyl-L-alanine amidase [Gaiellaceae bacterium]